MRSGIINSSFLIKEKNKIINNCMLTFSLLNYRLRLNNKNYF